MRVEDYYTQGRRGWVRLHEKGGKQHEMPAHHNLDTYLDAYVSAAGIAADRKGPLFRSVKGRTGQLTRNSLLQQDVATVGIKTEIGCHTFRATGITAYLKNGGKLGWPSRWRRMSPHGQLDYMTGAATTFRSMKSSGSRFGQAVR